VALDAGSGSGGGGELGSSAVWISCSLAQICLRKFTRAPTTTTTEIHRYTTIAMSGPKRPAHDTFGSSQLVKRTKPDAKAGSNAVAVVNGAGQNGALIRAVCTTHDAGEVRSLKLQCADRRPRAAAARCRVRSWSSLATLGKSSHVDLIRPASTLPRAPWIARYVSHVPELIWWFALTSYSTLAQFWRLRKLWHSHRTQAGST
jgi:hypothetical protein